MDYTNQYGEVIAIPVTEEVWLDDEFFAKEAEAHEGQL